MLNESYFEEKDGVIVMASGRSLLTGLFVGGIIGGAAVLLTAPSSGKQLREKMKTNYDSFEETIKRLKSDGLALKDQLIKAAKESTDVIKDVGGELQTSIKKWQEEIKPHQQDLQKEIADIEEIGRAHV